MNEETVVMCIEPSKRLSELCGFPYFIEKHIPTKELLDKGVITTEDIEEMSRGRQICKSIRMVN